MFDDFLVLVSIFYCSLQPFDQLMGLLNENYLEPAVSRSKIFHFDTRPVLSIYVDVSRDQTKPNFCEIPLSYLHPHSTILVVIYVNYFSGRAIFF